jgi:hypothetical protein
MPAIAARAFEIGNLVPAAGFSFCSVVVMVVMFDRVMFGRHIALCGMH